MAILSKLHPLIHPLFNQHQVQVSIKRDDLIHPIISGNKWRKLKYNLVHVQQLNNKAPNSLKNKQGVLSFGGSYSNHIHALAFACYQQKIPCVGIIRGEESNATNYTLTWARHWGMQLHFVDRQTYRLRNDADFLEQIQQKYKHYFIVPEGGSNELAIPGMAEVITELNQQTQFDTLITPVGSGGTIAGLIAGDCDTNNSQHQLLGIPVLKEGDYLKNEIIKLAPLSAKNHYNWKLLSQFHRGGYAKFTSQDAERILAFNKITGVDFEPVYSGKMILAFLDLLEQGYFSSGERVVLLHTGGMQGLGGMLERGILSADQWIIPRT